MAQAFSLCCPDDPERAAGTARRALLVVRWLLFPTHPDF